MALIGSTNGSKTQNANWFASHLSPGTDQFPTSVHVAMGTAAVVQYTLDGGTNWVNLNSGQSLEANNGYVFNIPLLTTDQFNLRHTNVSAVIVIFARVGQ